MFGANNHYSSGKVGNIALVNIDIAIQIFICNFFDFIFVIIYVSLHIFIIAVPEIIPIFFSHTRDYAFHARPIRKNAAFAKQFFKVALDILLLDHVPYAVAFLVGQFKLHILTVDGSDDRAYFRRRLFKVGVLIYVRERTGIKIVVCGQKIAL